MPPVRRWALGLSSLSNFIMVGGRVFVCWTSSFLLFRIRQARYLMALWCRLFMRGLILAFEIFKSFNFSMKRLCMALLHIL